MMRLVLMALALAAFAVVVHAAEHPSRAGERFPDAIRTGFTETIVADSLATFLTGTIAGLVGGG